mmetsp:Transcript_78838/g.178096  ORF Transcript_78838/g.178096 Transcript_78838/m.178096 type:complete len:167 (+) Transcript_78838:256-756(+)
MRLYENHTRVLVAKVNCVTGGRGLCIDHGVPTYPHFKYGDSKNLTAYEGGLEFEDLEKFVKLKLEPKCSPKYPDVCSKKEKKLLDEFMAMSDSELSDRIELMEGELKKADEEDQALLKNLNEQFYAKQAIRDEKEKVIRKSGLGLVQMVLAYKLKGSKSETSKTEL